MVAKKFPSDLSGMRFGKWLVLQESTLICRCRCDCGTERDVSRYSLLHGVSTSCGCTRMPIVEGQRFGHLTALRLDHRDKKTGAWWLCRCDCGKEVVKRGSDLVRSTTSCGCNQYSRRRIEDIGVRYGRLVVVGFHGMYRDCVCDCGNTVTVPRSSLASGATQSCGCLQREHASRLGATVGVKNGTAQSRYDWHVKINGKRVTVRSSYELIFAKYLLKHRIRFEYEPQRIQLAPDTIYIPDFYLPDTDTWVEVKGYARPEWLRKRAMFERAGYKLIVVTAASIDSYLPGFSYATWMDKNAHKYLREPQ